MAVVLVCAGVVALVVYGGTPHIGPTNTCAGINALNYTFTISADCRAVSFVELAAALACFLLAAFFALGARPRRPPPRV